MSELEVLARLYGTDKAVHGYCPLYERHLGYLRHDPIRLLEIGVERGASLRMWASYFRRATVVGVDIEPVEVVTTSRVTTVVNDIKDHVLTHPLDVVVDDGSHMADDVVAAWQRIWPWVVPGGWYVVEDLSTQFLPAWGGTPRGSRATELLDEVLHDIISQLATQRRDALEFHAYPRVIFIRKATKEDPYA